MNIEQMFRLKFNWTICMNYKHDWFFVYLHNVLLILLCVIFAHATDEDFVVGTALHRCVFFAQMHRTATAYIPCKTIVRKEFFCFAQCKWVRVYLVSDTVVKASVVVDNIVYHPRCCRALPEL